MFQTTNQSPTSITYMEEGYGIEEEKCLKKRLKNSLEILPEPAWVQTRCLDASQVHPLGSALQKTPRSWPPLQLKRSPNYVSPLTHQNGTCFHMFKSIISCDERSCSCHETKKPAFVGCKKRTHYIWLVVDLPSEKYEGELG